MISLQNTDVNNSSAENSIEPLEREEWMILSDIRVAFQQDNSPSTNYNWGSDRSKYNQQIVNDMASWIERNKESNQHQSTPNHDIVDINTLSEQQKKAYHLIKQHFESVPPLDPLHLIILGEGGTGKSYLINAIRNLLAHHCLITAPTGKAAFNIKGVTLHSLFKLPIGCKWQKELCGQLLIDLQHNLNHVQYILIDEFSYVGQTMLGWINKRCKQATGCQEEILGNLSFILIGDPAQLPPVADKPLYHSIPSNDIGEEGYLIYHMFHTVIQLTENHRVAGNNSKQHRFRELLKRLRTGDSTEDDWHLLLTRQP